MPPLPEAIILVLAPFAPLFSHRVWRHAQVLLLGAMLAPGARTVTAALRVMGLAAERHFTNDHRVLNRATWSARQGSRILLGLLITLLVPPGATVVLGADDTVERRSWPQDHGQGLLSGCGALQQEARHPLFRPEMGVDDAVGPRALEPPGVGPAVSHRLVSARRAVHMPTAQDQCGLGAADDEAGAALAAWAPMVLVVDGGFAAVSLALACVKYHVTMVSRLRWDAALYHPPGPQPPGKRGPKPTKGQRQRSLQNWAERSDTPWETVEVVWYGGQLKKLWVFSRTALWYTPRQPPVAIRYVLVADPEGKLRMEALFCTDLEATPVEILPWVVMRWSVEVTFEEGRAHLGLETQRQWSDQAIARTTPVLLALFSLVTVLALRLSQDGQIAVPVTAWYHKAEPTFSTGWPWYVSISGVPAIWCTLLRRQSSCNFLERFSSS